MELSYSGLWSWALNTKRNAIRRVGRGIIHWSGDDHVKVETENGVITQTKECQGLPEAGRKQEQNFLQILQEFDPDDTIIS